MLVTSDRKSPHFDISMIGSTVLLDGVKLARCLWANDVTGEACIAKLNAHGLMYAEGNEIAKEIVRGKVTIVQPVRFTPIEVESALKGRIEADIWYGKPEPGPGRKQYAFKVTAPDGRASYCTRWLTDTEAASLLAGGHAPSTGKPPLAGLQRCNDAPDTAGRTRYLGVAG